MIIDGLENPTGNTCTDAACDPYVQWTDGRGAFTYQPWMTNLVSEVNTDCFSWGSGGELYGWDNCGATYQFFMCQSKCYVEICGDPPDPSGLSNVLGMSATLGDEFHEQDVVT